MKKHTIIFFSFLFYLSLSACQNKKNNAEQAEASINAQDLEKHIMALASDEFQGRKPSTLGEELTTKYLAAAFESMGLQGAFENGSYFQKVPIITMHYQPQKQLNLKTKSGKLSLENIKDYIATTAHISDSIEIKDAPIVFAGYGIVAPEYNWDDYKNIDVKGKIVLVLVNDPGFATKDSTLFNGNAMTYYGRWPYKYEEAARQGAAGVWVIHNTQAAGYGWNVLTNTALTNLYVQTENGNKDHCALEGWITDTACEKLIAACGEDFSTLKQEALKKDFQAIELNTQLNIRIKTELKHTASKNVAAILKGTEKADECIVYSAHWDHFGIGPIDNGDSIYNGACDNAIPLSCMLETAKAFANLTEKPKRSVVFLSVTAEETGMIGSQYYAQHSPFPTEKTVANLNYELFIPMGRMRDVTITGYGQSELDTYVAEEAKKQDRYIVAEPFPENGMYYRSDHFRFAQVGIPSLFIKGWQDSREHGKEWAKTQINNYWANAYHKPGDNYYPDKAELSGNVEDAKLFFKIGYRLANETNFPKWHEGSEFKAIREPQ